MPSLSTKALLGAGMAVGGMTALRGMGDSAANRTKQVHLNAARKNDLSTPMYNPTVVKRAYDEFFQMKLAADAQKNSLFSALQGAATKTVGDAASHALSNVFVRPVDWAAKKIEKSLVTHPKQQQALASALKDPMVAQYQKDNPQSFNDFHQTLTQFAPNVATNPLAVRTFLSHGAATGGNLDMATLKLLSDTEKSHTGKGSDRSST